MQPRFILFKGNDFKLYRNKIGIKIASLDAEKAFDKLWRAGLFFKLIDRIDPSLWHLLKIYYDKSQGLFETD